MKHLCPSIEFSAFALLGLWQLPAFDLSAALWVGAIVAVGALAIVFIAIALPGIAIVATGSGLVSTLVSVAAVALAVGVVAGVAAGLYKGHQSSVEKERVERQVMQDTLTIHISFQAKPEDSQEAQKFVCVLSFNSLKGMEPPYQQEEKTIEVTGSSLGDFYAILGQELVDWFKTPVLADKFGEPRIAVIHSKPEPGVDVRDQITSLIEESAEEFSRKCNIQTTEISYENKNR